MKQTICFLILGVVISLQLQAQSPNFIKGKLIDSLTSEPLPFGSVILESVVQKSIIKGDLADEKGIFQFIGIRENNYIIRIEYVGYKTKIIEISPDKIEQQLDLGAIMLAPISQLLESVDVRGIKQAVVSTLEKKVFRSEVFEVAKGGTATDVLRNIPSIMINAEGEITLRGSKGFLILINGKATQLDAATALQQIPANTIEKVEMITAPSAKYDADGKAGIINIVTKKDTDNGLSLVSNLQYGLPRIKEYYNATEPQRYGGDITMNLKKQKLDIVLTANYLKNDIAGRRIGAASTTIGNIYTHFPSEGERSFSRNNYGIRANAIYTLSQSDEISMGFYSGQKTQYRVADIVYNNNTKTNLLTSETVGKTSYFNSNLVLKSGSFHVYNLDYKHTFANQSNIQFSGLYEKATLRGFTKNRNLNITNHADTLQYTLNTGENPLNALRLKVNYEKQMGIGKLALGYQFRNQQQSGNFIYLEKGGNNAPFIQNHDFSAQTNVLNRIHGVYMQYDGSYKKIEFSSGLRYENAFREFRDNKGTPPHLLQLSNLFPSATILYSFPKDLKLKAAYSRRVQRSTNNELNPYPEREHSETLEQGDPTIKPEFVGIYEIGLTKDYQKASFYWNIYRQQITDIVNRVNSVYNDSILNRIYTNAGNARLMGSDIGITYSPTKKIRIFFGGNTYNLKINGLLFDNTVVASKGWTYSINSNISYNFNSTFSTQFNCSYLSARNTAQGIDSRFYQPNFSLKKTFLENQLIMNLQWQNAALFGMKANEQRITTAGIDFYTTTNYIQERNIILLNLSYYFNKKEKMQKLPVSEFGEKEF